MRRPLRQLAPRRMRRGITLVEVLISVTILGVAATGIAGMSVWANRSSAQAEIAAARQTVLDAAVARVGAMSFDQLTLAAGCTDGSENAHEYMLCISVASQSEVLRRVKVRVTPASDLGVADSVTFDRTRSTPASPF